MDQADRYLKGIVEALDGLARGDRAGRDATEIRPGYLKYVVGQHLLFYRLGDTHLDVMRILHRRMDIASHLGE